MGKKLCLVFKKKTCEGNLQCASISKALAYPYHQSLDASEWNLSTRPAIQQ